MSTVSSEERTLQTPEIWLLTILITTLNNRLENLRPATQTEQRKPKGYRWDERRKCFIVFIQIEGRYHHLGCYREETDAIARFESIYDRAAYQRLSN